MTACGAPPSTGMALVVLQAPPGAGADVHTDRGAKQCPASLSQYPTSEGHCPPLQLDMDF